MFNEEGLDREVADHNTYLPIPGKEPENHPLIPSVLSPPPERVRSNVRVLREKVRKNSR